MSITLPNELVDIIFGLLDSPSDRSQLARVGRQFNTVGRPHVWRDLRARISAIATLRRVKTTLLKDAALAGSVRLFDIPFVLVPSDSPNFELSRIPCLMKILPRLTGLRTLIISLGCYLAFAGPTGVEGHFASFPVFPQLQHLMVPSSFAFMYFALRHSTLVALHLGEAAAVFLDVPNQPEDVDTSLYQPLEYLTVQDPFALRQHLVFDKTQPVEGGVEMYRPTAPSCSIRLDSPEWLDPEANLIDSLEKHESLSSCSLHLPEEDLFNLDLICSEFVSTAQTSAGSTKKVRSLRMGIRDVDHYPPGPFLSTLAYQAAVLAGLFPSLEHLELDELGRRYALGRRSSVPPHELDCSYVKALKAQTVGIFASIQSLQSLRWSDGETFRRSPDNAETILSQGVKSRRLSHYFPLHVDVYSDSDECFVRRCGEVVQITL